MSQIQEEIKRLQHKAELIELANKLFSSDSLFKTALVRKASTEAIQELTKAVKDFLSSFVSCVESDVSISSIIDLTPEDVVKLKALSDRLSAKVEAPQVSPVPIPNVGRKIMVERTQPVQQNKPTVPVSGVGKRGILLDSIPAYNLDGPPTSDGIPLKDKLIPDVEVTILGASGDDLRVKAGNIQFSIPKECVEITQY